MVLFHRQIFQDMLIIGTSDLLKVRLFNQETDKPLAGYRRIPHKESDSIPL